MGRIFDIQRGCIDDGPGIRTTVFLKGCPLNCLWCHNPESKSFEIQEYLDKKKCVGRDVTVEEVLALVLADKSYYEASQGGMTVSGGEPMMQPDFTYELLAGAKAQGIHTCMETSGFARQEIVERLLGVTDLFLFDMKAPSSLHRQLTGVENDLILSNFRYLYEKGANLLVRCPIIPTKNDTEEHFAFLRSIKRDYPNILDLQIMPYHNMGNEKARKLGMDVLFDAKNPQQDQIQQWKDRVR